MFITPISVTIDAITATIAGELDDLDVLVIRNIGQMVGELCDDKSDHAG